MFLPIGACNEGRFEPKVKGAGERKGVFDLTEEGWVARSAWFGCEEDVGCVFDVAIFGEEVSVSMGVKRCER